MLYAELHGKLSSAERLEELQARDARHRQGHQRKDREDDGPVTVGNVKNKHKLVFDVPGPWTRTRYSMSACDDPGHRSGDSDFSRPV